MQKLLFFFVALLALYSTGHAQPILGANSLNTVGDKIQRQPCQATTLTEGPAGANQNWNFSTLRPKNGYDYTIHYLDPAQTPKSDLFPFANLATKYTDAGGDISYAYFNQTGTEYWQLGATFEENKEILSSPNLLARVPMTFDQTINSTFEGQQDFGSYQAAIYASKTMHYDGYGTLVLPIATYTNAIRTKTTETRTDSITSFSGGAYALNITKSTTYAWFAPGIKSAVFEIRYSGVTTVTYIPGFPLQQSVQPSDKVLTYQINSISTSVTTPDVKPTTLRLLSANPCNDGLLRIEAKCSDNRPVVIAIGDAQGRIVASQSGADGVFHFDLSRLPAGTYWACARTFQGRPASKPITILKP
jgi:hypothetical protein